MCINGCLENMVFMGLGRVCSNDLWLHGTGFLHCFMVLWRVRYKDLWFLRRVGPRIYGSGTGLVQGFMVPGRVWSKVLFLEGFGPRRFMVSGRVCSKDLWFREGFGPRYCSGTGLLQKFMVLGRICSKDLWFRDGFGPRYCSGTDLLKEIWSFLV